MTSTSKIAVITGGNRGLGRAAALKLAQAGTDVVLTYRSNEAEAADVVAAIEGLGAKAVALQLDTTQLATFPTFVESLTAVLEQKWGRRNFDFLLNNAGVGGSTPLGSTTEADFDALINVHVKGVYFLTQALAPVIADGGRIVNISSGLSRFTGPGYSVYAAAKGAVEVLTRYWAMELGGRGITVNTVAPGATATDFGGGMIRDNDGYRGAIVSTTALGRVGDPDDIGGVVASLFSPEMGWVNAQRIEASGGARL